MATLDDSGLQVDTLAAVVSRMQTSLSGEFGFTLATSDNAQVTKLLKVFAREVVSVQQALLPVLTSLSLDLATGVQLVNLAALNGSQRLAATRSSICSARSFWTSASRQMPHTIPCSRSAGSGV